MRLDPIERTNLTISAGAVALSWAVLSPAFALSLAFGSLLEAVNFRGLISGARLLFGGELAGARPWMGFFGLRFALLAGGIAAALAVGAHPVGLVVGLSVILPAAVIEAWRSRPPVDPEATALDPDDPAWELWDPWLARERFEDGEEDA